ncbi:hypothetical protein [Streptomyces sp. NPDC004330]|uniref:hypothetical protein n=1 Tax=Streptomyces sp. NPDC004330 TaxID=3364700 RepID=UPI0036827AC6
MSDVRYWIKSKLMENGFTSTILQDHHLQISRDTFPDVLVVCIGLETGKLFEADDLRRLAGSSPEAGFVVVVPTRITHAAYELAEQLGICVAGFGELTNALRDDEDVSRHVSSQEKYERRRLTHNSIVRSIKRKGYHAYEVERVGLRPLRIVTTNDYELTADAVYSILENYSEISPDLIVVTNPSCLGFSTDSLQAASRAGIPIVRFGDFLDNLDTSWT